jgi:hypothetical protein
MLCSFFSKGQFEMVSQDMNIYVKHENTEWGNGASFYDFNRDGWDDLTTANGDSAIQFFVNNGSGILEEFEITLPITITHQVIAIIWVDYDNDKDSDLFITQFGGRLFLLQNNGEFSFIDVTESAGLPLSEYKYYGASFADVNEDGYLDFYVSKYYNPINYPQSEYSSLFFLGSASGIFTNATISAGLLQPPSPSFQSVFFDYDQDGLLDLFIIIDRSIWPNELFRNNGDGTFTEVSQDMDADTGIDSMCANVGDFDNDLDYDIFITDGPTGNVLLKNNFPLPFMNIADSDVIEVNQSCWGSLWIDVDNDGLQDLFVSTTVGLFTSSQNLFFKNIGEEGFEDATIEYGIVGDLSPSMCTIMGDLNNDGYFDYYNNNNDPFNSDLWRNVGGSNNFLALTLEGTISNSDAIGTNVKAFFGGQQAMRLKQFGESYIAQNSGKEIFGLGENEIVDSLIIEWPNGLIEKYFNIVSNHFYHFIEGNAPNQTYQLALFDTSICSGQIIEIDGGEGVNWEWNNGITERYLYVSEPGEYQVQLTDQNGIVYQSNVINISLQAPPIANVISYNPTCFDYSNGTVQINYTYEENTLLYFNDEVNSNTISNLSAGTYNYSVVSQSGCVTSGTVILEAPEQVLSVFNTINGNCSGDYGTFELVEISGGTPPYTTDFFGLNPDQLPDGNHLFLILDSQGCPFVGEFEIQIPEPIQITASSSPQIGDVLGQINIVANGGVGELEYFINEISIGNSSTIEVLSGTHSITVVDQNGCTETIEIEVGFEISVVENNIAFELYPNPASSIITMQASGAEISKELLVYSSTGALILNQKINSFKTNIDISNWSEGIYLVRLGNQQRMLIKQ